MLNLNLADGLYLSSKQVSKTTAPVVTEVPTDHIVVIDCSGSMYTELPKIRNQLKNKLAMMMREADSLSIIWFSSKKQFGVVVEAVALRTAVDLSGVHRAIDNFLKPVGLTGFVDPLQEVERMIGRVQKPGRAINLFFMSDGYDNQWTQEQILQAVEKLQPIVSSAAVIEYGYYCNKPLMVKMSERLGASEILAENFLQYEPIFETAMTKKIMGGKKIETRLDTAPLHGFAFTIGDGEIVTYGVDGRSVMVPEGMRDIYWFSEVPWSTNVVRPDEFLPEEIQPLYAGLVPLTQRMLSTDIFRVLKALGDVRLIRQFAQCFGKQAYNEFQNAATECVFDPAKRHTDGYNPNEVPAEDAYTIIDLLYQLAENDGNLFYPSHKSFSYERIGRRAVEADRVLSEAESQRVGDIAARLTQTRDPSEILRLQAELSGLIENKKGVTFAPTSPDAGYPVSSLVLNEDRPNISAQVKIPGSVDLSDALLTAPNAVKSALLPSFPTHIYRNYTIVRDGIRNVRVLPVSLTQETHAVLVKNGVIEDVEWRPDHIYEIDLMSLPLINRQMVKTVSAKDMFEKQYALLQAKAAQKVFNYYFDQHFPAVSSAGIVEVYGTETAEWLAGIGIKDYGYSPKVTLADATESYYGKELTVSLSGMSSLPTVKSVLDKLGKGKKLVAREALLSSALDEMDQMLKSPSYFSLDEIVRKEILKIWLSNRKRDTIVLCRKLMRDVAQIKFAVIVGQTWLFPSLDENTMELELGGQNIQCTANMNEVEIKV